MLLSSAFLVGAIIGLWFTKQALLPVRLPRRRAIPSFFAGWLTNELVFHHLLWQLVFSGVFVAAGALQHWPGWVALGLTLAQWLLNLTIVRDILAAPRVIDHALVQALGEGHRSELPAGDDSWDKIDVAPLIIPFKQRRRGVSVERNRPFARADGVELKVDIFRPVEDDGGPRPALVYVHGGAWIIGYREYQGTPLLNEMVRHGWVGFRPQYRLSPFAAFPAHVIDVKRCIAWIRRHADELGVDPSFIAVAGGSAGGHLAAVTALTADRPELQPGFEEADTSVQAAIPIYGVFDFHALAEYQGEEARAFLAQWVMKSTPDENPELWDLASPIRLGRPDAPPMFVIHGGRDTLTPPSVAGAFAAELAQVSSSPVARAELPGAQHAFDVFPSARTAAVVRGVARFLTVIRERSRSQSSASDPSDRLSGAAG